MPTAQTMVGPSGYYDHHWGFVYFHGMTETMNGKYIDNMDPDLWSAPDLVSSDTPLAAMDDGFQLVKHVDGTTLFAHLWTTDVDYRAESGFKGRRTGLIVHMDDVGAEEYARRCRREKRSGL